MIFKSTVPKATRHGELEPYFTVRVARFNDKMGGVFSLILRLVFNEPPFFFFFLELTRQSQWQVLGTAHSSENEQENQLI